MSNLIHDILQDPGEYMLVLLLLAGLILFWAGLCLSAFWSLRASTPRRRFWLALLPFVFGALGAWAQLPFSMESGGVRLSFDFRWLFILPLLVGGASLIRIRRRRNETIPPKPANATAALPNTPGPTTVL
jgi:hypothetical protein